MNNQNSEKIKNFWKDPETRQIIISKILNTMRQQTQRNIHQSFQQLFSIQRKTGRKVKNQLMKILMNLRKIRDFKQKDSK